MSKKFEPGERRQKWKSPQNIFASIHETSCFSGLYTFNMSLLDFKTKLKSNFVVIVAHVSIPDWYTRSIDPQVQVWEPVKHLVDLLWRSSVRWTVMSSHLKLAAGVADLVDIGQRTSIVRCASLRQTELLNLLKLHLRVKNKSTLYCRTDAEQKAWGSEV